MRVQALMLSRWDESVFLAQKFAKKEVADKFEHLLAGL